MGISVRRGFNLFLFLLQLEISTGFVLDTVFFTHSASITPFRKLYSSSLPRCIEECKIRSWCSFINYKTPIQRCDLIKDGGFTEVNTSVIMGRKSDWNMVIVLLFCCFSLL